MSLGSNLRFPTQKASTPMGKVLKSWGASGYRKSAVWTPLVIFVVTALAALLLNGGTQTGASIIGFAGAEQVNLATAEGGRLTRVSVTAGQQVVEGQVVAQLDSSTLDAEMKVLEAEIQQLVSQVSATDAEAGRQEIMDARQLSQSVDQAQVALAKEEGALGEATARLEALTQEKTRLEALVKERLATADELAKISLEHARIAREVAERPHNISHLKEQVENAQALLKRPQRNYRETITSPIRQELEVAERRLELLMARREQLTVKAPARGQVASVVHHVGEVIPAGETLVTLVREIPARVVACVSEQQALEVRAGMSAVLRARDATSRALSAQVVALGPLVNEMPIRCRRSPSVPVWGREVILQLSQPASMVPGEAFDVRLDWDSASQLAGTDTIGTPAARSFLENAISSAEGSALALTGESGQRTQTTIDPQATGGQASNGSASHPAVVTRQALAQRVPVKPLDLGGLDGRRFNLEPSGLIWVPSLARYLVVSDDPGTDNAGKHTPVLFALKLNGQVDASPIPVVGVASLNDLESITQASDGGLYVLASQSTNQKGKRPSDRTAFLKLQMEGTMGAEEGLGSQRLTVVSEVHLAEALDALDAQALVRLGIPGGTQELNIEGMAMGPDGLYLGLKAPLDAEGNALIWRLDQPEVFLKTGNLAAAGLHLHARVKVDADLEGRPAPGGIAELLFLPDGRLLIASTPSGTKEGHQGGRLWRVEAPNANPNGSTLSVELLQRFEGLKPEGLSLSPTPGEAVVVFDTGGPAPQWASIPWGR